MLSNIILVSLFAFIHVFQLAKGERTPNRAGSRFVFPSAPESVSELTVRLAGLLPESNSRLFSIQRVKPAAEIAIQYVRAANIFSVRNTSTSGGNTGKLTKLSISYRNSNCSESMAMNEAINFYVQSDVSVFFGPVCDFAAAPVARQIVFWQLPMVSVGAIARDFRLRRQTIYPMLTRAGPVNLHDLVRGFLKTMKIFNWRRYKILYEKNAQENIVTQFCHLTTETFVFDTEENIPPAERPDVRYYRIPEDRTTPNLNEKRIEKLLIGEIGKTNFSGI